VAKGNGWEGRLDPAKMLHPGDQVRVMTDEAVKARTEEMLKQFDAKVEEMKRAAAKPTENGDPALFGGNRNGEGDVAPATDQAKDPKAAAPDATGDPALFNGTRTGEGEVKPPPADGLLRDSNGNVVKDSSGNPVKAGAPAPVDATQGKVEPAPAAAPVDATKGKVEPAAQPAGRDPNLKASTDSAAPAVVAGSDVPSPGDDFAVTAVSAQAKADADYQAKQRAASERRLVQGNNPLETFEPPKLS
jgi:hypothetical protein